MPVLCQGSIVCARVCDPAGGNEKERPLVVITKDSDISTDPLVAVAVTSTFRRPLQAGQIEIPHHPDGKTRTGLKKPSIAICDWCVAIPKSRITKIIGVVPPRIMLEIMRGVLNPPGSATQS